MQNKDRNINFEGQSIFTGMDIHKKSWKVCILTEEFEHKVMVIPAKVEVLANYLKENFPGAKYKCAYEAGFSGYWIQQQLESLGIECMISHASDIPTKNKEKVYKNDGSDCRKIANSLRANMLEGIYKIEDEKLKDRSLIRTRDIFVKEQTRIKNRIKSLLSFYGIETPLDICDIHWSKKYISYLESIDLKKESGNIALRSMICILVKLRTQIVEVTKSIRELSSKEDYKEDVENLTSIPGISILSAMTILTEIVRINRFKTFTHLKSYVGLIPRQYSSGEKDYKGHLSIRGNRFLRNKLIENSWVAVRKDPSLMMAYNKYHLRYKLPKCRAIIKIASKLLSRIRFVLITKSPYEYRIA